MATTQVPECPECGSKSWQKDIQLLENERVYVWESQGVSLVDAKSLEVEASETIEPWQCDNEHPATDDIGDILDELS